MNVRNVCPPFLHGFKCKFVINAFSTVGILYMLLKHKTLVLVYTLETGSIYCKEPLGITLLPYFFLKPTLKIETVESKYVSCVANLNTCISTFQCLYKFFV